MRTNTRTITAASAPLNMIVIIYRIAGAPWCCAVSWHPAGGNDCPKEPIIKNQRRGWGKGINP